ncbi:MAG: hypothetical protein LBL04_13575 [Bacteroidales bacterium]|jgi:hypothetical protein|nr:hypothetical protein [Bacteroidales bacterium]
MKKSFLKIAVMAMVAGIVATGCGSSKKVEVAPSMTRRVAVQTPCYDFFMDKPGEYMAGLGISSPKADERDALLEANRVALADISTRYLGVIKNGTQSYLKDTTVPSGKKSSENKLEGIATTAGSKAINEYANRVCFQTMEVIDAGTFIGYTVVHVPVAKVNKEIASALEVAKVDYDAEKFQKWLQQELDAQAASQNANQ